MAAPDANRTDEKVIGSMAASRSASRQRMEFVAKAKSARPAQMTVRVTHAGTGAMFWLTLNRLCGSYFIFVFANRP